MNYETAQVSYSFGKEIRQDLIFQGINILNQRKKVYFTDFGLQSMEVVKGIALNQNDGNAQINATDYTSGGPYTNMGSADIAKLRVWLFDITINDYAINGLPLGALLLQAPLTALSKVPYLRLNHKIDWSKSYVMNNATFSTPAEPYVLQFRIILE